MSAEETFIKWCKDNYAALKESGIWAVPRSGLITLCLGISLILLASSRAQMFSDEDKMINENQTYTVRGVINVVHLPIPDGDQHGSSLPWIAKTSPVNEQGSVTGGYFFLFTTESYTLNGREIDENGEYKPVRIKDQQIFQLAPDEHQVAKIEAAVTKPVELEIQPFIRNTGYHHTPVLFMVSSVKVIEGAVKESAQTPVYAPVVKLLTPGKDPKKPMRMTAKVGLRRTVVVRMKMGMEMAMGENKVRGQIPEIRITMDLNVTNVSADGDIRYELKFNKGEVLEDAQVDKKDAVVPKAALAEMLAEMQGMKAHVIVSSRGFTKEADFVIPPKMMDPETKQFMEQIKQLPYQMSRPLPEEAVGVGAKWLTTATVKQDGMVLKQFITSELRSLSGDAAKVSFTVKQTGMAVDVKFTSSGNGEINLDLGRLIPSLATVHATSRVIETMAQGQDMATKLDMTMGMQGK